MPESLEKVVEMEEEVASTRDLLDMALGRRRGEVGDVHDEEGRRSSMDFNSGKKMFFI